MSEDAGAMLLAAIEAVRELGVEVEGLRQDMAEARAAAKTLKRLRKSASERTRRRRERSGAGGIDAAVREAIYKRDGRRCLVCGATERLSLDHIVPRVKGGDDHESNLQTLCIPCNSRKNGGDFRIAAVILEPQGGA